MRGGASDGPPSTGLGSWSERAPQKVQDSLSRNLQAGLSGEQAQPHMKEAQSLTEVLDELEGSLEGRDRISIAEIQEALGERSFGPLLLVLGLAALTPLGVIPGLPTVFALTIGLLAGQLVIGRRHFWLPRQVRERSAPVHRVGQALRFARRPAEVLDRLIRPRLQIFAGAGWTRAVAVVCILVAFAIPPLELVPFGVAAPAAAITAFGLGLTARDGVLVLLALAASATSLGLIGHVLFG